MDPGADWTGRAGEGDAQKTHKDVRPSIVGGRRRAWCIAALLCKMLDVSTWFYCKCVSLHGLKRYKYGL